jgi:hypothetical protein
MANLSEGPACGAFFGCVLLPEFAGTALAAADTAPL